MTDSTSALGVVESAPADPLAQLDEAVRLLATSRDLGEVTRIRNMAEAARQYARAVSRGLEAQNHAAEIKLRAERRAGELLAEMRETGERARSGKELQAATLSDLSIEKTQAHRWQAIARVPAPTFEHHISQTVESGGELTSAGVLKLARPVTYRCRTPIEPVETPARAQLLVGDVRQALATLEPESVQVAVTSPPYFGLRSYSTQPQVWGDQQHEHEWTFGTRPAASGGPSVKQESNVGSWFPESQHGSCACGAWLGELGTEPTPELYVEHLVEVMRAVRSVLRRDGLLFLNIDDSYGGGGRGPSGWNGIGDQEQRQGFINRRADRSFASRLEGGTQTVDVQLGAPAGVKPKSLLGIPWRVALALEADGWYWRSTIIWAKTAPMPESMDDRPTKAWEPIFMFSRSASYAYYPDAVCDESTGANMRNFWLLGPEPFPGAHFSTFPSAVPERCILAGSRTGDVVLDPFAGAGTTSVVAARLGRDSVSVELNPEYARMAAERIEGDACATVDVRTL